MPVLDPDTFAQVAVNVLAVAEACLNDNDPAGAPENVYVSHCRPPDDCCDILSVWYEAFRPSRNFPDTSIEPMRCNNLTVAADLQLEVLRSCYPVVRDNAKSPFPPPAAIQAAADNLNITARVLWCCMLESYDLGLLTPDGSCVDIAFGQMTPICPRGGCAGWLWNITVAIGPCC